VNVRGNEKKYKKIIEMDIDERISHRHEKVRKPEKCSKSQFKQ